ncbi:Asr1405/Asl0597 family protein [Leptolyngbya sp. PCC 6406]|uniref:Asr1405/Asl0597 family protein n=1 Tax=Leptolyngbya sp. PCC 6406 TaxID=1173264 RepID=UPI0002ACA773|nr:Asr1405/Asl0597 family protein [Leptolyngbya sp. PCC 6406]
MNQSPTLPSWGQTVSVRRCDRWSIHRRLQELNIPCACPADGTLRVDVNHALALLLVRSAVRQFSTSRQEGIDWLERCWQTQEVCAANS